MKKILIILFVTFTFLSCVTTPKEADYRSEESLTKTKIAFVNETGYIRMIFWLDFDGKRVLHAMLEPGEDYASETYMTHPWLITDKNTNALRIYKPTKKYRKVTINF